MTLLRKAFWTVGFGLAAILLATPASAQIVQSIQGGFGAFFPRGYDSRDPADTVVADLNDAQPLDFSIGEFRSADVFGEWDLQFGHHVEVGAGVGYYSSHVPSVYRDLVNSDGSEIRQTLALRIVPLSAVVRFLPFGTARTAQPYVGAGVAALRWRYSESGQFVDPTDNSIFSDRFAATGTTAAPLALIGLRVPLGGDIYGFSLEWRYSSPSATREDWRTAFSATRSI